MHNKVRNLILTEYITIPFLFPCRSRRVRRNALRMSYLLNCCVSGGTRDRWVKPYIPINVRVCAYLSGRAKRRVAQYFCRSSVKTNNRAATQYQWVNWFISEMERFKQSVFRTLQALHPYWPISFAIAAHASGSFNACAHRYHYQRTPNHSWPQIRWVQTTF